MNNEEFNDNLFFVFEKLLIDKELAEKFAKCKTEDELYNFCLKIKGGYTKEEWKKFAEIVYRLTIDKENDKILLDNDLEEIGGGNMANNIGKKALSGTLAALTAATALQIGSVNVSAASDSSKPRTSVSQKSSSSKWRRIIKGVLIGVGVAAVAAALGYGVYRFIEYKKEKNNTPKVDVDLGVKKDQTLGIKNLGNSCYLNAVAQQITSDPGLRKRILDDRVDNHPGQEKLFDAVQKLVRCAVNGRHGIEMREDYTEILKSSLTDAGIYDGNQQDAEEYFRRIVRTLYPKQGVSVLNPMEIPKIPGRTISVQDMVNHGGGFSVDRAIGQLIRSGDENFKEIQKNFPKNKETETKSDRLLRMDAYRQYVSSNTHQLDPEVDFNSGKPLKMLTKKERRLDEPLFNGKFYPSEGGRVYIQIKRFGQDDKGERYKDQTFVNVPEELKIDGKKYRFVGSVLHLGSSLNGGHYTSYTSDDGKKFRLFNDYTSREADKSEVIRETGKNGTIVVYQLGDS